MSTDDTLGMNYEMRRKARQPVPPREDSRWRQYLALTLASVFALGILILGIWIYWSLTYVSTIRARVCGGTVVLSTDFDARLVRLDVCEGQHVAKGDVVAWFDDSEHRAELASAKAGTVLKESTREGRRRELETADLSLKLAKLQAEEDIRRSKADLMSAEAVFRRLQAGAREEDIQAAQARLDSARARQSLYELKVRQSTLLNERGIEPEIELEIKKTELATQLNTVREAELELKTLQNGAREEDIEVARQTVNARKADFSLAQMKKQEIKKLELSLAQKEAELAQAEAELVKAEADLRVKQAVLERMAIKSPVDGIVSRVYFQPGEVIRKGEPLVEVIAESGGRWIEGYVLEDDAFRIQPGQSVQVEIGIDSGFYCSGEIAELGHSTSSAANRDRGFSELGNFGRPAPVWVRIKLPEIDPLPRPGTSANARIRVR